MTTVIDPAMANAVPANSGGFSSREVEQRRRYNALEGGLRMLARAEIVKRHDPRYLAETGLLQFLDSSVDTYGRIVRMLADAYRLAPARRWDSPVDTALWGMVADPAWDIAMEELLKLSYACCVSFARPYVVDGVLTLEVIPPHSVIDVVWLSPTKLSSIKYWLDPEQSIEWTDTAWRIQRADGTDVPGWTFHNYGKVPVCVMRTTWPTGSDYWTWRRRSDLLEAAVLIAVWNSYIGRIAAYQSHLQLVERPMPRGEGEIMPSLGVVDEIRTGPDTVLRGNYDVISLQSDISKYVDQTEIRIKRIASDYGLPAELVSAGNFRSAEERMVAHAALAEHRSGLLKLVRPADNDIMKTAVMVWNEDGDGSKFSMSKPIIDFSEPQVIFSPEQKVAIAEARQRLGLESSVDELMRDRQDIETREDAMLIIQRNLDEQGAVAEYRRSFQLSNKLEQVAEVVVEDDGYEDSGSQDDEPV